MKKDVVRFGKSLLVVVVLLVAGDIAVGTIADYVAGNLPVPNAHNLDAKECYVLHQMNDEIVLLGSSRGHHHYVTSVLNDSIDAFFGEHHTLYNAAIVGQFASSNSCVAEVILERYRPMLVVFDLSEDWLCTDRGGNPKLAAPFYWKDTVVRRYIDSKISAKDKVLMKSSLYRYNSHLLPLLSCFLKSSSTDGGYLPIYGSFMDTTAAPSASATAEPLDKDITANVERVMELYKEAGVPLVVVCSPKFRSADSNRRLKALCDVHDVPFIDLMDTPYFNAHPELFKDLTHLNDDGAQIFTAMFFESLKPYLSTL
jgi:hypothetical protein